MHVLDTAIVSFRRRNGSLFDHAVLIKWVWRDEMTEEIGAMERVDGFEVELSSDVESEGGCWGGERALLGWQSCPQKGYFRDSFLKKMPERRKWVPS